MQTVCAVNDKLRGCHPFLYDNKIRIFRLSAAASRIWPYPGMGYTLLCKAEMRYLLTWDASRYCLLTLCDSISALTHRYYKSPRVVVSTAAFHARVRGSIPGLGGLKEKMFLPHPRVKVSIAGSLRDREVACSASDRQGSNFESCVWRTVSSQSSHHPQEVPLAQFSLYVLKGGLNPDSFHFIYKSRFPTNTDQSEQGT